MKTNHVIVCHAGAEGTAFRCEHCTLQYTPPFPMPLEQYVEQGKGFALMHRRCEKPPEPTRQMTLPHHQYAIDASTDEQAPEIDPPVHPDQLRPYLDDEAPEHDKPELLDSDDAFGKFFGHAKDHEQLLADLACVLQNKGGAPSKEALLEAIGAVGSTCFDEAAHWTRMQLATMNRSEYPEFEPYLPMRPQPMPRALQAAFKVPKAKKTPAPRKKAAAPKDTSEQAMVTAEANAYLESVRAEP